MRKSASAKKKQKKESGDNNDSTQLYGLYSTEYADFCSGSWFPITYVGPPVDPAAPPSDVPVAPLLPPVDSTDPILVRWSSKSRNEYDAESLSLAFVRCASEFSRLPVASIKPRKRVLVRDVLESMDFEGVSYWLATIVSEPTTAKKGKKNARATVEVEYQVRNNDEQREERCAPLYSTSHACAPSDSVSFLASFSLEHDVATDFGAGRLHLRAAEGEGPVEAGAVQARSSVARCGDRGG